MKKRRLIIPIFGILFVICLVIAVFLPGILSSRIAYNWTLACVETRRIVKAESNFSQKHNGKFATFEQLVESGLLTSDISKSQQHGYNFSLTISDNGYKLNAIPADYKRSSLRSGIGAPSFFANERGIVYSADKKGERATIEDSEEEDCDENSL